MKKIAPALLIMTLFPVGRVLAAEASAGGPVFDLATMVLAVGLNGILGLGVFAIGVILVGLLVDRFRPWINVEKKASHENRQPQPHTHHFPPGSLDDAISRERQDAY